MAIDHHETDLASTTSEPSQEGEAIHAQVDRIVEELLSQGIIVQCLTDEKLWFDGTDGKGYLVGKGENASAEKKPLNVSLKPESAQAANDFIDSWVPFSPNE